MTPWPFDRAAGIVDFVTAKATASGNLARFLRGGVLLGQPLSARTRNGGEPHQPPHRFYPARIARAVKEE